MDFDEATGTYRDNDLVITESNIYYDEHLTAKYGFDSIYELKVTVHPSYLFYEQYELGQGEHLSVHGMDITTPGVYMDNLLSSYGCDSVYQIVVNPKRVREYHWDKTICQGEYFQFVDGRKLTETGNYNCTDKNGDIYYLSLTVIPVNYTEQTIVITDKALKPCDGVDPSCMSYINPQNGKLYKNLHVGYNIIEERSASGTMCDNIHRVTILVTTYYSDWERIPLCEGSQKEIDGVLITQPGEYQNLCFNPITGEMDYLHRIIVYAAKSYDMPAVDVTICQNDLPYDFGGHLLNRAGSYEFTNATKEGCDSIIRINLTVNPTFQYFEEATIPDYGSYTWLKDGNVYDSTYAAGDYYYYESTPENCEIKYTLRLNIIPTQRYASQATICSGDEYPWRGKMLKDPGVYTDTIYRPEILSSVIYSLDLKVLEPTDVDDLRTHADDACADDREFRLNFAYTGARPTSCNIYFDAQAKSVGFKDIIDTPLYNDDRVIYIPIPQRGDTLPNGKNNYIRPNIYHMTLVFDNGACKPGTSKDIEFKIRYPDWIIKQNWDDVVAPLRSGIIGGYEFSNIEWEVKNSEGNIVYSRQGNSLGYLHYDGRLGVGYEVVMYATRKGENYAIETCPMVIEAPGSWTPTPTISDPFYVAPTQAPRYMPVVNVTAPHGGQYEIFSFTGTLIEKGTLEEGTMPLTLPNVNGIYFIRTTYGEESQTHKILIY